MVLVTHEIIIRAACEVLETTAAAKVVGSKERSQPNGDFAELVATLSIMGRGGSPLSHHVKSPVPPKIVELELETGTMDVSLRTS